MKYLLILVFFIIGFAAGCKSPSDKIADKFKEIDKELERSDERADSLLQNTKLGGFDNPDSIEHILNNASFYIRTFKKELDSADKEGERVDIAEKLIIQSPKGDSLYKYITGMYELAVHYGDSNAKRKYAVLIKHTSNEWLNAYFRKVPTVAAKTILSKFQKDLVQIRTLIMYASILELKNKILSEK